MGWGMACRALSRPDHLRWRMHLGQSYPCKKSNKPTNYAPCAAPQADEAVKAAEQGGKMKRGSPIKAFFETASLIFIAEWGDR